MNILGHTVKGVLLLANIGAGAGFLLCAYSPSLSPVAHPVLSCAGLFSLFIAGCTGVCTSLAVLLQTVFVGTAGLSAVGWRGYCDVLSFSQCTGNGRRRGVEILDV